MNKNEKNATFSCIKQPVNMPVTITLTLPVNFLGDIHSALCDGDLRDVIGCLYFLENFPPDTKKSLHALGYDPGQFLIHKQGD